MLFHFVKFDPLVSRGFSLLVLRRKTGYTKSDIPHRIVFVDKTFFYSDVEIISALYRKCKRYCSPAITLFPIDSVKDKCHNIIYTVIV